jgi:Global regulator protein family
VVRVEGGQVRLGIEAPREIAVVRAELLGAYGPESAPNGCRPGPDHPGVKTPAVAIPGIGIRRRGPSR